MYNIIAGADTGILERVAVRGRSPELSASPEIFEKLMRFSILGSEWPRISFKMGPLQNKKQ